MVQVIDNARLLMIVSANFDVASVIVGDKQEHRITEYLVIPDSHGNDVSLPVGIDLPFSGPYAAVARPGTPNGEHLLNLASISLMFGTIDQFKDTVNRIFGEHAVALADTARSIIFGSLESGDQLAE